VLDAAYDLFTRQGIRAVGVDTIVDQAGVAKMTFYRHFPSKEDLVLAVLQKREDLWTREWLEGQIRSRATHPEERLVLILDIFDEWFQRPDFEGCFFIKSVLEASERDERIRAASALHLANVREFVSSLAAEAGIAHPDDFARKWQILLEGAIVSAVAGDKLAARRARDVGVLLLESEARTDATR
jgi:AcrR family transcriptional regulator